MASTNSGDQFGFGRGHVRVQKSVNICPSFQIGFTGEIGSANKLGGFGN